jgi:hypothetical protein
LSIACLCLSLCNYLMAIAKLSLKKTEKLEETRLKGYPKCF